MSRIFGRGERRAMDASWFAIDRNGSASVTAETAPTLAPVYAALRHIVDYVSTLPVDSLRVDGDKRRPTSLPLLLRSADGPGRIGMGPWFGQCAYGLAAHGNAVGWVLDWDGWGNPTDVEWLARNEWDYYESTGKWFVNGKPITNPSRIFHVPWIVPPGKKLGLAPIENYASIVRAGLSAQEYADMRRGGGMPPAVLKNISKVLDHDQSARVRERAVSAFASGKPFVTGNDWDLTLTQIPPNHAQFIETLKLSANQIAAIYGLDPREIGGDATSSLTYSTDESRSLNRANNMRPYLVRIEQAIDRALPEKQIVRFNVNATIRTDIKTRVEVLGAQIADGRLSVNEARELEDRPKVTGGDFHNVPAPKAEPTVRQGDTP